MSFDNRTETIFGILLAAGGGSRFVGDDHKLLASLRGRRVIDWSLSSLLGSHLGSRPDRLIVVSGAVDLGLAPDVARRFIDVPNPLWSDGQATSLRAGLDEAVARGADSVVVGLGDQPFVDSSAWDLVAAASEPIAIATYQGKRGNPVRLHSSVWALLPDKGDYGARNLIALRPDLVGEVACSGSAADIDTMKDLQRWNSSTNSPSIVQSTRPGPS